MTIKKAVITAAGLGTRMLPLTKTVPKEMLPILEKPAIQYIVEEAAAAGITDILILTNRSKTVMEDYFDYVPELEAKLEADGRQADIAVIRAPADLARISFTRQKQTLGLGHAISCAREFAGGEPFAVMLGDDIIRGCNPVIGQLAAQYLRHRCTVVGVAPVSDEQLAKYCSLDVRPTDDPRLFDVANMIEKPQPSQFYSSYAILGRYILTPDIFDILETLPRGYNGEIQLTDALAIMSTTGNVKAYAFEGERFDIGGMEGYLETLVAFASGDPRYGPWFKDMAKKYIK